MPKVKAARKPVIPGEGPYCPICLNAKAEWLADPDNFDIMDHVRRHKGEQLCTR